MCSSDLSGSEGSTRPILQYIYDTGFTNYRMGYASAMSYIFFAVIILVTVAPRLIARTQKDILTRDGLNLDKFPACTPEWAFENGWAL